MSEQKEKKKKICIELFSGSGNLSKCLNKNDDFKCYTFDIRKRKGICTPDFKIDISKLKSIQIINLIKNIQDLKEIKIFALWIGLPCDVWSYASGGFHWNKNGTPKTQKCLDHIKLMKHCFKLIEQTKPRYWFIENPRGRLRYNKELINFLVKNNGMTKQLTMSSYGFGSQKPTNIFTNYHKLKFKPLDSYGRGNKSAQLFNNLTVNQRQTYPIEFCEHITKELKKSTWHF
mgnify:CR=1 FL=1